MTKERRQYGREFKLDAVRLLETSGKRAAEIERELGIGKGNLARSRSLASRIRREQPGCFPWPRVSHSRARGTGATEAPVANCRAGA